jgi:nitrate/TMAO reductase-like tetraheme cytochrome c subunit
MNPKKYFKLSYLIAVVATLAVLFLFSVFDSVTTSSGYCLTCHEMQATAGTNWRNSRHFTNALGMVAECSDCHVNPGFLGFFGSKAWPAVRDHYVHFFGNSDPAAMNWEELRARARQNIANDACKRCHVNLTASLKSKAAMAAHLEAEQGGAENYRNCMNCHVQPLHPAVSVWNLDAGFDRLFSHIEVESHGSPDDLYIIVDDGVYDVTEFCKFHSGGSWCFAPGIDNTAVCRTCHQGPAGPDKSAYLDSFGATQDYSLFPYKEPKTRLGTLVNIRDKAGQYFVAPFRLLPMQPTVDQVGLQDDLGITGRYSVGDKGALREREE